MSEGPVGFTLHLQIADEHDDVHDDVNDPSTAWPESRPSVLAGTLRLTAPGSDPRDGCEALLFDPSAVTDGIACSEDRILNARPGAYAVSYRRRTIPTRS
jgi:catalase